MPNEFVARLGIIALQNSQVTGSLSTTCDSIFNGVCVGEGGGSVVSNTRVGVNTLQYNSTGAQNTAVGLYALRNNNIGAFNNGASPNTVEFRLKTTGSYTNYSQSLIGCFSKSRRV